MALENEPHPSNEGAYRLTATHALRERVERKEDECRQMRVLLDWLEDCPDIPQEAEECLWSFFMSSNSRF